MSDDLLKRAATMADEAAATIAESKKHRDADDAERFRALARDLRAASEWQPTHRHKNGNLYKLIGRASGAGGAGEAVVYQSRDGKLWYRRPWSFDELFKEVPRA